jgi:hypothetical protein
MQAHCFLAFLVTAVPAAAQFDNAAVLGSVKDPSGASVAGAGVTLTNRNTGISSTAKTDISGNYQFSSVRIGSYSLRVTMAGFKAAVAEAVEVAVGAGSASTSSFNLATPAPLLR